MIVYWIAAAQALAYLGAVPLNLAVALRFDPGEGGPRLGVGLSTFEARFALRRAAGAIARPKPRRRRRKGPGLPTVWRFARGLRVEGLSLQGRLSLGDAAATALVCGAARALDAGLRGPAPRVRLRLSPDFGDGPRVELRGMIRARAGQVMYAAARAGLYDAHRRFVQWKDTRSRASCAPPWKTSGT